MYTMLNRTESVLEMKMAKTSAMIHKEMLFFMSTTLNFYVLTSYSMKYQMSDTVLILNKQCKQNGVIHTDWDLI